MSGKSSWAGKTSIILSFFLLLRSFSAGDFSSALTSLSTLRASRPEDPLVAANLLVTRFKALSSGNAKSTRQSMTDLALELEEALKPTTEG